MTDHVERDFKKHLYEYIVVIKEFLEILGVKSTNDVMAYHEWGQRHNLNCLLIHFMLYQ